MPINRQVEVSWRAHESQWHVSITLVSLTDEVHLHTQLITRTGHRKHMGQTLLKLSYVINIAIIIEDRSKQQEQKEAQGQGKENLTHQVQGPFSKP